MSFGYGTAIDEALRDFGIPPEGRIAVLSEARGAKPGTYDAAIAPGSLDGLRPDDALEILLRAVRSRGTVAIWSSEIVGGFKSFFAIGFARFAVRAVPVQAGDVMQTAYVYLGEKP